MKKLVLIVVALMGFNSMAESPVDFQTCTEGDLRTLEASTHFAPEAIKSLVDSEVLDNIRFCYVQKPRFFHPAVCGTHITQVDTFIITTKNQSNYRIVVDSSYSSCIRMRRVPTIKSLTYGPEQMAIPFN